MNDVKCKCFIVLTDFKPRFHKFVKLKTSASTVKRPFFYINAVSECNINIVFKNNININIVSVSTQVV